MTFWEHLDELRKVVFRSALVIVALMVAAFFCKDYIFGFILAPLSSDFALYQWFNYLLGLFGLGQMETFNIQMINIEMAAQFFTHLRVSFYVALIVAMPFVFYQLWTFVAPALYEKEKQAVRKSFGFAAVLFYLGLIVGYYLVFPLTVRFLGTYQVSVDVPNQISLKSYIGMFISLILIMGIVFEMPALSAVLSRFGIINKELLKKYRRHAAVILMLVAAIITPSGDAVTLFFVAVPLYCLYEVSIIVCKKKSVEEDGEGGAGGYGGDGDSADGSDGSDGSGGAGDGCVAGDGVAADVAVNDSADGCADDSRRKTSADGCADDSRRKTSADGCADDSRRKTSADGCADDSRRKTSADGCADDS
ncbi:MAG: twin-arginine translocase subunit TatC, partial [Bacteroidales bacterium]|nr:twin-arginine translocase subunit TatC [Bacteroidales bacterium]